MWNFLMGVLAVIAFGTIGFWVFLFLWSCFMVGFLEFRKSGWATFFFILSIVLLWLAGTVSFTWLFSTPWHLLLIPGYLLAGGLWAIFKWWREVKKLANKYKDLRMEFLREKNITSNVVPENLREDLLLYTKYRVFTEYDWGLRFSEQGIIPPHPNEHKEEIYMWIVFWPWSMLWFVVDDPVRRVLKGIFRGIRQFLIKISEHAFKDIKDDYAVPQKKNQKQTS